MTGKRILFSNDLSEVNSNSASTKINNFFEERGTNMSFGSVLHNKTDYLP